MAKIRLASPLQEDSIVDGPGLRIVLWTQGCPHGCLHCHNPQTHSMDQGFLIDSEEIIQCINESKIQTGITLSGGEPFLQSKELLPIVHVAIAKQLNIWAYSGFTYEQLMSNKQQAELLSYIDVLVDGKYIEEQKDYRLRFKGSRNQRIIDVKESIKNETVILSSFDDHNQF